MKQIIKGFIEYRPAMYQGDAEYSFHTCTLPDLGYVKVMAHTIEIDIPEDFDPREKMVDLLKAEKKKLMADFHKRCKEIEKQISELTAITYEVTA